MLYEGAFEVVDIDREGKKFDKVSRVEMRGMDLELTLDVHVELYPMHRGDWFNLALFSTLRLDQKGDKNVYNQDKEPSHADKYDYVCHGVVFEIASRPQNSEGEVYASFGGLLMCLKGDIQRHLVQISRDSRLYLCLKKID